MTNHTINDMSMIYWVDENSQDPISRSLLNDLHSNVFNEAKELHCLVNPDTALLDMGAHIGLFSLFFSAKGHSLFSFEASPKNAAVLMESKKLR